MSDETERLKLAHERIGELVTENAQLREFIRNFIEHSGPADGYTMLDMVRLWWEQERTRADRLLKLVENHEAYTRDLNPHLERAQKVLSSTSGHLGKHLVEALCDEVEQLRNDLAVREKEKS